MTLEEFEQTYPLWVIWQAVGQKPSEFLLAMRMPSALLDNLLELDAAFDALSRINAERIAAEQEEIRKRTGSVR